MVALPPLPVTYLLYFEIGSAQLTRASRANLQTILEQISARLAVDVSITGHTDTVGGDKTNDTLSRKRSEAIAAMIQHGVKRSGIPVQDISLAYHGKTLLAVETPDNTPELLNRRVEVSIR
jgi:outer membrane protein OmpA-like peptidoglycan-associated protein